MDFTEKMEKAMAMLHEACKLNDTWADCEYCPFVDYCDALEEAGLGTPDKDEFMPQ